MCRVDRRRRLRIGQLWFDAHRQDAFGRMHASGRLLRASREYGALYVFRSRNVQQSLRRYDVSGHCPACSRRGPERSRKTTWKTFLKAHWGAVAATDFFMVEILTMIGLVR
jgi:hypothetical protein